ncbi:sulfite exporter TauE/SafE family protein [Nakamurella lactea]|uniref:sulfite exporter TauE/SafE family protein n=1 Tax=Nakamurella lactea TaxID=459515 RepID=UPI00040522D1|nr:TSUP family transporter [Nakamurella lactea]
MHADVLMLLMVVLAATGAGWVDAVVGGGGLVQLPVLLLAFPGIAPTTLLATDKLSSIAGTATAAMGFARRTRLHWRLAAPVGLLAIAASGLGATLAGLVPPAVFRPAVLLVLLAIGVLVVLRPTLGSGSRPHRRSVGRAVLAVAVLGAVLPVYNGMIGPGTGSMMLMTLTALWGLDFVIASATTKVINLGSNIGALVVLAAHGPVFWVLGAAMAAGNMGGAWLGTRTALRRGTGFIRIALLCVVSALLVKIGIDQFG